jgi:GAF domain-containing protein
MSNAFFHLDSAVPILEQAISSIATAVNAPAAWLYFLDSDRQTLRLAAALNAPPPFREKIAPVTETTCLAEYISGERKTPQLFACSQLAEGSFAGRHTLRFHWTLPLFNGRRLTGLFNLGYADPPEFSDAELKMIVSLSQSLGVLADLSNSQQEAQRYATHTAFLLLLARSLAETGDLQTVFSAVVEQTASMLDAQDVVVWLTSRDGRQLKPAAALTASVARRLWRPQPRQKGLIGWVAEHGATLSLTHVAEDERFNAAVDKLERLDDYSLTATPLYHQREVIGVLAAYHKAGQLVAKQDLLLLEGVATLTAGAIRNLTLLQEQREYANQQQTLYKMSRQLSSGLDLSATLRRSLGWISRLCPVEVSLLWLTDDHGIAPTASLGLELPQGRNLYRSFTDAGIAGWVAQRGHAVIVDDPAKNPHFSQELISLLQLTPRNIMATPMTYHGRVIGVATLINKIGEQFSQNDLTLISMATEMIAIAVGNARLHQQALDMMQDRERLHGQRVQKERLAIIGRLTASLSHEINNPMQAIRGALTLAMEELDDPDSLYDYIKLSLDESQRVVRLINRLRSVYRPQMDTPEQLDLNNVIQESLAMAHKELSHQNIAVAVDLTPEPTTIWAVASQIHLVTLNLLLNLGDLIGHQAGGGEMLIRSYLRTGEGDLVWVGLELISNSVTAAIGAWTEDETVESPQQTSFDLLLSQDIITALGGTVSIAPSENQLLIVVELPSDQR